MLVRSRYTRGAVEVRSWCGRGAVEVPSWCGRGTLVVRSRYARGAVERSRYAVGTVLVRSRYARGALPVRYVSLTFQRAILYITYTHYIYIHTTLNISQAITIEWKEICT